MILSKMILSNVSCFPELPRAPQALSHLSETVVVWQVGRVASTGFGREVERVTVQRLGGSTVRLETVNQRANVGTRTGVSVRYHRDYAPDAQSSIANPGTRANSLRLWVINVRFRDRAIAAITRSLGPMGCPTDSR
jgi:hypothetical protein